MSAVVVCSAILAWIASQTKQPILVAYFLCGIFLGPAGLSIVTDIELLHEMSRFGVMLLLFLAGLVLHPDRLAKFFKKAATITIAGSALSFLLVFMVLKIWGFTTADCTVSAIALMFSSTILVVKLLPTTTLHQKYMGSICIAILIAQDLLAVLFLLLIGPHEQGIIQFLWLPVKVVLLTFGAVFGEQYVVRKMMRKADRYNEVLLMLCLGWCAAVALSAELIGIPYEVGAFIAGVTIARGKIALILSEELKPLRDFFLMFFFFVLGATLELEQLRSIWLPSLVISLLIAGSRPFWLSFLFKKLGEEDDFATETGFRLGQASEFALVIAMAASASGKLTPQIAQLVSLTTVLSMLFSSYLVVMKYPTPIGVRPKLQKD
ncbi:hypothetical protein BVX97_04040 [bacterium E08(2017)]|nr:hypothetical protein BVX97_04040 [bacterium E08(2017)]